MLRLNETAASIVLFLQSALPNTQGTSFVYQSYVFFLIRRLF
jgi:hypothetical protein